MQLSRTIGITRAAEQQLALAFTLLARRHQRDADIRDDSSIFAQWCERHVTALGPIAERYGHQATEEPARLRSGVLYGSRVGAIGLLQDLHDTSLLAHNARLAWTTLAQAAAELRDKELQRICLMSAVETDRQIAWLLTHLKQTAPQAQTVHPNRLSELRGSLPRRPTVAAVPDALWAPVAGGALILFTGGLALLAGQPWLFPSLGPTAYLQGESPAHPSARAYNSIVGHLVGLLVGFATVFALAVRNDPAPLTSGELTGGRMLAAAIALAMTMLVANLLHASHPPAAATTLLVALGAVHNREQALYLMLGVLVLSLAGELLRHVRLGDAKHLIQPRARRELVRLPRLRRVASPHA